MAIETVWLESDRLILRLPELEDVPALCAYFTENRAFHKPTSPLVFEDFYTEDYWRERVPGIWRDAASDCALRMFLFRKDAPGRVIGQVGLSAILRGPAQYCNMGYHQAEKEQGKGHMREILPLAIAHVFGALDLHRIQANYMPTNERSGKLLRHLGFVVEGYARDYLIINGAWRDHVLTSLTRPSTLIS